MKRIKNFLKSLRKRKGILIVFIILFLVGFYLIRRFVFPLRNGFEEAKVKRGIVRDELILSGVVKAEERASFSFLTSGELDYLGVIEGQEVKKGDV